MFTPFVYTVDVLTYITAVRLSSIINCPIGVINCSFWLWPLLGHNDSEVQFEVFSPTGGECSILASPRDVTEVRECGEEGGSRTVRRPQCEVCVRVHGAVPSGTAPLPSVSWQDFIWATEQACAERRGAHRSVSHSARCCCRRRSFILCPSAAADEEPDDTAVVWWVWL